MYIAVPDLMFLLERAISAEYRFAILHATAPGRDVLLDTRSTEDPLGWRAERRFPPHVGLRLRLRELRDGPKAPENSG